MVPETWPGLMGLPTTEHVTLQRAIQLHSLVDYMKNTKVQLQHAQTTLTISVVITIIAGLATHQESKNGLVNRWLKLTKRVQLELDCKY